MKGEINMYIWRVEYLVNDEENEFYERQHAGLFSTKEKGLTFVRESMGENGEVIEQTESLVVVNFPHPDIYTEYIRYFISEEEVL